MEKIEFNHYKGLIEKRKLPKLFKFYSLETDKDLEKLTTLEKECIWMDVANKQNDPFELANVAIDNNILMNNQKYQFLFDEIRRTIDNNKQNIKIASFTRLMSYNISMWGYYANCCKGFCCEFEFIDKSKNTRNSIMPITYDKEINKIENNFLKAYERFYKIINYGFGNVIQQSDLILDLIYDLSCYKGLSWKHEKEYRALYIGDYPKGEEIPFSDLNIKLKAIYAGPKCNKINISTLKLIAAKLNASFYEMEIDEEEYKLNIK